MLYPSISECENDEIRYRRLLILNDISPKIYSYLFTKNNNFMTLDLTGRLFSQANPECELNRLDQLNVRFKSVVVM